MQIVNSLGQTIEAEWVSVPTMDGRLVVSVTGGAPHEVAAFFEHADRLEYTENNAPAVAEGYTVLIAMTRRNAQDSWLVSMIKA